MTVIASSDTENVQLGQNNENNVLVVQQETFETPLDDFVDETVISQTPPGKPVITPEDKLIIPQSSQVKKNTQLTHDETKLAIILSGIIGGSFLIWYLKS